jgi:ribosomal protein S27AE
MTFAQYTLENSPVTARPECPRCAAQMYLARIELEKPNFETRIFECPRCQHSEVIMVQF